MKNKLKEETKQLAHCLPDLFTLQTITTEDVGRKCIYGTEKCNSFFNRAICFCFLGKMGASCL